MTRGELYRVLRPPGTDPRKFRVFAVVSRQVLIDSRFSTTEEEIADFWDRHSLDDYG